ncbi:hypothetical protein GCM10009839_89260 [Catenulispora yoronensis]|uniref:non-specific serine/threonine protein kinase n=1 Tax=Catenulispora yoronensis TaxID=450799 RepID=A0ABN2VL00_9ACTN
MDVGERYVLGRLVGEGATACVYEAEDSVLRREVAVKVFRDGNPGGNAQRVSEEVRILTALSHPHLLPLFDAGRSADGQSFIVMPLVRGTTLANMVARGPVGPREAKKIGTALAEALSHIHARGIVHRDVKPSNVLLAEDGMPFLADFGFAHAEDGPALTATNCVVGTAGYLAPEQAEGHATTPAADVYALGLVLLEALTGERTYRGTPLERAVANALRPPVIPARLGPGWLETLRMMTARDPSERPTAAEAGRLLAAAEDTLPEVTAQDDTMMLTPVLVSAPVPVPVPVPVLASVPVPAPVPVLASAPVSEPVSVPVKASSRRRLTALGAAGFAALTVLGLGVGTDWLAFGAAGPSRPAAPVTTAPPGAGPAGSRPPTPAPATAPAATPSATSPRPAGTTSAPVVQQHPADQVLNAPTTCRSDKGNGHGKHKCQGADGDSADSNR